MPISFPGDVAGQAKPTTFPGIHQVGGVEKFQTVDGSITNIGNLNAGNITAGTLNVDRLGAGSITADKLAVSYIVVGGGAADVNANATEISPGKILISGNTQLADWRHASDQTLIDGGEIYANSVTADKINANELSAISATLGTVTSGTLKTSPSGQRVEMSGANDDLRFYNSGGNLRGIIGAGDGTLKVESGTESLFLEAGNGNIELLNSDLRLGGNNINDVDTIRTDNIDDNGAGFISTNDDLFVDGNMTIGSWLSVNGDLDMEGNDINDVDTLNANTKNFLIPHPDGSNRWLKYTAVESPEVAVSCRGIGTVGPDGRVSITPPDHFTAVTAPTGLVTADLTAVGDTPVTLKAVPTTARFGVKGVPGTKFMWRLTAVRKGFLDNEVEFDRDGNNPIALNYIESKRRSAEFTKLRVAHNKKRATRRAAFEATVAEKIAIMEAMGPESR